MSKLPPCSSKSAAQLAAAASRAAAVAGPNAIPATSFRSHCVEEDEGVECSCDARMYLRDENDLAIKDADGDDNCIDDVDGDDENVQGG